MNSFSLIRKRKIVNRIIAKRKLAQCTAKRLPEVNFVVSLRLYCVAVDTLNQWTRFDELNRLFTQVN